ncbi:MAG: flagellin FliC [Piscirickettsiaceae bacterium]|nr:MAG: flagellin FliC [Piscirickettsiaceae bacterium]
MPQIINTNIASLTAQRNLNTSQNALNTSLQRLSSGLRINSAKDDAAGLAISERFTTQIRGLNQAQRNSNDGISLAQTAEGDLAQITNNLQRIRELAVQSANATNSTSDRAALQQEVSELIAEIDRVATTSSFNGVSLLDGSFASQQFQVGANAGETVSINSISSARTFSLGQTNGVTIANTTAVVGDVAAGTLTINGNTLGAVDGDAAALAAAISASDGNLTATAASNVQTAIAFTDVVGTASAAATINATAVGGAFTTQVSSAAAETTSLTVGGITAYTQTSAAGAESFTAANADVQLLANTAAINTAGFTIAGTIAGGDLIFSRVDGASFDIVSTEGFATTTGGFAGADFAGGTNTVNNGSIAVAAVAPDYSLTLGGSTIDLTAAASDGTITATEVAALINAVDGFVASASGATLDITAADGRNIALVESGAGAAATGFAALSTTFRSVVDTITSANEDLVISGAGAAQAGLTAGTTAASATLIGTTIADTTVATVDGANATILAVDSALTTINSSRASLGAIQNRFESVVSSIQTTTENLSAARSRIRDADFAEETAALTRAQILQQAGISILSQANALPQNVLALLQ